MLVPALHALSGEIGPRPGRCGRELECRGWGEGIANWARGDAIAP